MDPTLDLDKDQSSAATLPSEPAHAEPESHDDSESAAQADETKPAPQNGSLGEADGQAEEPEWQQLARTLTISAEAKPPEAKLQDLLTDNAGFYQRWHGSTEGLKNRTVESVLNSLCYHMIAGCWSDQEITDTLVSFSVSKGRQPGLAEHHATRIVKMRSLVEANARKAENRQEREESKNTKDSSKSDGSDKTDSESRAEIMFGTLRARIKKEGGQFLRDDDGQFHLVLKDRRIPLKADADNYSLARLMLDTCNSSTLPPYARSAIQRLQVYADEKVGGMRLQRFSALSPDGKRVYVPTAGGQLLRIAADGITEVPNGKNEDDVWVEHPCDEPLRYNNSDPQAGLKLFERWVVDNQACAQEEMKLFVAIAEGLYPYIRAVCLNRLIVVHVGAAQQGKTSGAQRFTRLHGLGDVKGDYSVAALAALGDNGLLVLDNREQANLTNSLIDFLLFLATGAVRGRSTADGRLRESRSGRPVGVVTSIEGVFRDELQKRCIEVEFKVSGENIGRSHIERQINGHRHEMLSGLMHVLRLYFEIAAENRPTPNPIPKFEEHFLALCNLLRAYGEAAGNPEGWAEDIIGRWAEILSQREPDENELEQPLIRVIDVAAAGELPEPSLVLDITHDGKQGRLLVTNGTTLRTGLQGLRLLDLALPRTAQGLTRRLRSSDFVSIAVLDDENAPEIPELRRSAGQRAIGIFQPYPEPDE